MPSRRGRARVSPGQEDGGSDRRRGAPDRLPRRRPAHRVGRCWGTRRPCERATFRQPRGRGSGELRQGP
eukprot:416854-Alexandrium_andersonii.AAC.1